MQDRRAAIIQSYINKLNAIQRGYNDKTNQNIIRILANTKHTLPSVRVQYVILTSSATSQ